MYRYIVYLNDKLDRTISINMIKVIIMIVIIISLLYLLKEFYDNKDKALYYKILLLLVIILNFYSIYYLISYDRYLVKNYYYIGLLLALLTINTNIILTIIFKRNSINYILKFLKGKTF